MILAYLITFLFGLAVGSFLNVVIHRCLYGGNPFEGYSKCPHCDHRLFPADLIPLASFILLRGKCRYCGKNISAQYPLVELATAFAFSLIFVSWFTGVAKLNIFAFIDLVFLLFTAGVLISLFVTDLRESVLPNSIVLPAVAVTLVYKGFLLVLGVLPLFTFSLDILTALAVALIFFSLVYFSGEKALGGGDVKLAFLIGLVAGWPQVLVALFVGFLTGGFLAVMLILTGRKRLGQSVPLGPFLIAGTAVAMAWGQPLIDFYLSLIV